MFSDFFYKVTVAFTGVLLPFCLFFAGVYLLFRIGRYIYRPAFVMRSVLSKQECEKNTGRSPFSSLCLALAGTLGVGNITGVTSAILIAGPGCVFWMWICAIVSAVLKFSEILLAVRYRKKDMDGKYCGGAYYYIKDGLGASGLAVFFCLLCLITSFTMGNMTQTKAASDGLLISTGISPYITGAVMLILVLFLSLGGADIISAFTLRIIPLLCGAYTICCLIILFIGRDRIPGITSLILSEAFTPKAGLGGILGVILSPALRLGITRGIMSSEAGCGTAATAHASASTDSPVRQGFFGIFEVFCDTLLLCTLTAYVVLLSGTVPTENATSFALECFSYFLGAPAKTFLGISLFLFALASLASWAFYGQSALLYLGAGKKTVVFYGIIFSAFAFTGCILPETKIWEFSDLSVALMAVINITAVLLLSGKVIKESRNFYIKNRNKHSNKQTPKQKK